MHTSFPKSVEYNQLELEVIDIDLNDMEYKFDETQFTEPKKYLALVITHALGYPFNFEKLLLWAKKNNITVFEDGIQSQFFPTYIGNPLSTIVCFSCGLDKVPFAFGGSFGFVNNPNDIPLCDAIRKERSSIKRQTKQERFSKLLEHFLLWAIYRHHTIHMILYWMIRLSGEQIHTFARIIRKNVSGFQHERNKYHVQPSTALLRSMCDALEYDLISVHQQMAEKKFKLRTLLSKEACDFYFPWKKNFGDSGPYFHCWVKNVDKFLNFMSNNGYCTLGHQSWTNLPKAPFTNDLLSHLALLPMVYAQSDSQIEKLAKTLETFHQQHTFLPTPAAPCKVTP